MATQKQHGSLDPVILRRCFRRPRICVNEPPHQARHKREHHAKVQRVHDVDGQDLHPHADGSIEQG
eukprot:14262864-Alexandrium_andersonii.AAC.1